MNKTIKELPEHGRPREKLRERGAAALTDEELIAAIIGMGTAKIDVRTMAKHVVELIRKHREGLTLEHLRSVLSPPPPAPPPSRRRGVTCVLETQAHCRRSLGRWRPVCHRERACGRDLRGAVCRTLRTRVEWDALSCGRNSLQGAWDVTILRSTSQSCARLAKPRSSSLGAPVAAARRTRP